MQNFVYLKEIFYKLFFQVRVSSYSDCHYCTTSFGKVETNPAGVKQSKQAAVLMCSGNFKKFLRKCLWCCPSFVNFKASMIIQILPSFVNMLNKQ